jgi:hypothetical protein
MTEAYPVGRLPRIIPIRVANQRVLDAYLQERREWGSSRPDP